MTGTKKNIRVKGIILSSFLVFILFTYNNCSRVIIGSNEKTVSTELILKKYTEPTDYILKVSGHELRFKGSKLDDKVFSISNLSLHPHTDSFKEAVFFEKGRESVFPLRINAKNPNRDTALLRLKSKNSKLRVFLR